MPESPAQRRARIDQEKNKKALEDNINEQSVQTELSELQQKFDDIINGIFPDDLKELKDFVQIERLLLIQSIRELISIKESQRGTQETVSLVNTNIDELVEELSTPPNANPDPNQ